MLRLAKYPMFAAGLASIAVCGSVRAQDVQAPTASQAPAPAPTSPIETQARAPGSPGASPKRRAPAPVGSEVNTPALQQANADEKAQSSPTKPHLDPFPVEAAGWSRPRSTYFFDSHWEEDWEPLQKAGLAPPLKATPLFNDLATLTLSGEDRMRAHVYGNGQLAKGNDYTELQNRTLIGADLHVTPFFRFYSELGHADLSENGNPEVQSVTGKQKQTLSLQQAFGDFNYHTPGFLGGAMVGRMEFTDAPEQLISIGNGPNLLQTWNGYRLYLHTGRFRLGYFSAYPTDQNLGTGYFNQTISHAEWIRAITGSVELLNNGPRSNLFITPLYINNFNRSIAEGNSTGIDHRYTYGARMVGRVGPVTIDWMGYDQTGDHISRPVSAFLSSESQTVKITSFGVDTDIGFRFDAASGGGGLNKTGPTHLFNPIYTDKGIYGEAEIFSYQNILVMAPLVSLRLTQRARLNFEYDFVYRENVNDAFYTPTKPYTNTQNSKIPYSGGQTRVNYYYDLTRNIFLRLELDQFHSGESLRQAHFGDAFNIMPDVVLRY